MTGQSQNSDDGGATGGEADAAAAAAAAAAAGGGGGDTPPKLFWEDFTDAGLKTAPAVLKHKTVEEMARGLVAAENRLGVPADQLIRLPTKPDDAAAFTEIFRKLGAPETADGYGLKLPDEAPEHLKAMAGELAGAFHKANLTPAQTQPLIEMLTAQAAAADAADAAAAEKATADCNAALKTEWGAKFDTYHKEIDKLVLDTVGEDGMAALNKSGMGNNVTLMKMLAKFADLKAEPGKAPGGDGQVKIDRAMTPAEAYAARIALDNDPVKGKALRDGADPMHAAVLAERMKLFEMENPQPKT